MNAALLAALLAASPARAACPHPPSGRFELLVVGDSTAAGFAYGGAPDLAGLASGALGGSVGGRPIETRTLAKAGMTLLPQARDLEAAVRCRAKEPGALLIYAGHNDRPGAPVPSFWEQLQLKVLFRWAPWRELAMQARKRGLGRPPSSALVYEHQLRRVVRLGLDAGLTPILVAPAANMAGVDPGLTADPRAPSSARLAAALEPGLALEAAGKPRQALEAYARLARETPALSAYAAYRSGLCWRALGRPLDARRELWRAVDLSRRDSFGRATTQQLDAVRRVAREYDLRLVDAASLFIARAPDGLPGDELFLDAQHPNARGMILLAQALADETAAAFGDARPARLPLPVSDEDLPRVKRVEARLRAARWLFNVSIGHFRPAHRLALAERRWREAAALAPGDFSALFGLCLVDAARKSDLAASPRGAAWLAAYPSPWAARFEIPPADWPGVLARLRAHGVSASLLAEADRAYALAAGPRPGL